jgi:hypothetical protein
MGGIPGRPDLNQQNEDHKISSIKVPRLRPDLARYNEAGLTWARIGHAQNKPICALHGDDAEGLVTALRRISHAGRSQRSNAA